MITNENVVAFEANSDLSTILPTSGSTSRSTSGATSRSTSDTTSIDDGSTAGSFKGNDDVVKAEMHATTRVRNKKREEKKSAEESMHCEEGNLDYNW